jgi:LuxR family transcriptional regulator, maltose regulon positive regulatory protein
LQRDTIATHVNTKFQPPRLGAATVPRPRLERMLDEIRDHPLTLVAAPAGFGKTTSIRRWQEAREAQAGWLTLDQGDNDAGQFIMSLIMAVQRSDPSIGHNTVHLFRQPSRPETRELVETLADELWELEQPRILVLDECERVLEPDAWQVVTTIIDARPPLLHLVLLARSDPPLPFGRFRLRGQLLEVRAADLQLSFAETAALLRLKAHIDSPEIAESVHRSMHGWPAGVTLTALAMQRESMHGEAPAAALPGAGENALDGVADEVIDRLSDEEKDAVLASSLPERITPELLAAMLERPEQTCRHLLEGFRLSGLCSGLAGERQATYVFHPLFKQLFSVRVTRRFGRSRMIDLHRRAARWHIEHGQTREAVQHYLEAGDIDAAVDLLQSAIPLAFDREDWPSVAGWLGQLPADLVLDRPPLALGWCWILFFKGQFGALASYQEALRERLARLEAPSTEIAAWTAESWLVGTYATLGMTYDPQEILEQLERAAVALPTDRLFLTGHLVHQTAWALQAAGRPDEAVDLLERSLARFGGRIDAAYARPALALPILLRHEGKIPDAEGTALTLVESVERAGLPVGAAWIRLVLGWICFQRNDLVAAKRHLDRVVSHQDVAHSLALREAMLLLVRVHEIEGDRVAADGVMRRLRELLSQRGATELLSAARAVEAWIGLQRGDIEAARIWAADRRGAALGLTPALINHPLAMKIRVLLGFGDPTSLREALSLSGAFAEQVRTLHFPFRLPEIALFEAIAQSRLGNAEAAEAALLRSLADPVAPYLVREYLDMGSLVKPVLDHVVARGRAPAFGVDLLRMLQAEGESGPDTAPQASGDWDRTHDPLLVLTNRELDVLTRLDQRLSYKEIADALSISPLTVKRHASNVYAKLGAMNRREAVAIARGMGWRPDA